MTFSVDDMTRDDWPAVRAIYGEGLATGLAAFTTTPARWGAWHAGHLRIGRIVARGADGDVLGFAALSPVPDT